MTRIEINIILYCFFDIKKLRSRGVAVLRDMAQIIPARDKILPNLDWYSDFYRSGTVEESHLTSPIANF